MKTRCLSLLAGCAAPLMFAAPAPAAFMGVTTESRPNAFGLSVVEVFAQFDQPGDLLLGVAGTPGSPLNISVTGGTFYQHPMGSDRAPFAGVVATSPSLAYDTFVTIGVNLFDPTLTSGGQPEDLMFMLPGWPGFEADRLAVTDSSWAVLPSARQANAFDPAFVAGDGRVLIAQLATANGTGFEGTVLLQYMSGGLPGQAVASFAHAIPGPGALALLAIAGVCRGRRRRR
ncbi:MAG: hypothetical protein ACYSWT_11670 [Planctomycetota bacterium]